MYKFVEVYEKLSAYDREKQKQERLWALRSVHINPKFIVLMREDQDLQDQIENEVDVAGLHPKAKVTKLTMSSAGNTKLWVTVVGGLDKLAEGLDATNK